MKKDIHPDYHEIIIKKVNGDEIASRSTWGKKGGVLQLDVDISTHPAWQDGKGLHLQKTGQMEKFASKFGGLDFAKAKSGKSTDDSAAASA